MISGLVDSVLALMEVKAELDPEVSEATERFRRLVEQVYPARREESQPINVKRLGDELMAFVKS